MADPTQPDEHDLELRKFALDRRKFKFELQKYKDEKANRDLQREKAQEELRDLKKPWWKKSAYLSPMATITVAVVGGLIAFGTDALKSNLPRLLSERQELSKKNTELRASNSQLSDRIKAAQGQITALQNQKEALAAQLPLDRFQALMGVLERKTALEPLQLDDPAFRDAYQAAIDAGPGSEIVRIIERKRTNRSSPASLRAGFEFILYKVTRVEAYKQALAADSLHSFADVVSAGWIRDRRTVEPYVTMLTDRSIFGPQERVDHLKAMFGRIDMSDAANGADYALIYVLATLDDDSVLRFRDPWIEYLKFAETSIDWMTWPDVYSSSFTFTPSAPEKPSLAAFSPQGFAIRLTTLIATDPITRAADIDAAPGIPSAPTRCPFPADVPVCSIFMPDRATLKANNRLVQRSAFVVRGGDDKSHFVDWLNSRPHLLELFDFSYYAAPHVAARKSRLQTLPDGVFRKLMHREWITEVEASSGFK